MTTSERPYWRTSILSTRFFHNDKSKDPEPKAQIKHEDFLQSSLLHSARLKRNLEESRKAFFNMQEQVKSEVKNSKELVAKTIHKTPAEAAGAQKKVSAKKISFKIKKTSSIYRKNSNTSRLTTSSANSVAELTSRFNKLDNPKPSKFVNSSKNKEAVATSASSRNKSQSDDQQQQISFTRRPSVKRTTSSRKIAEVTSAKNKPAIGQVKATIEIFETITSRLSPTNENNELPSVGKPIVPEKKFGPEVIDIVNKNRERSSRFLPANRQRRKDATSVRCDDDASALAERTIAETCDVDRFDEPNTDALHTTKYEPLNVSEAILETRPKTDTSAATRKPRRVIDAPAKSVAQMPNKSFLWAGNMPEYPQIKILEELYDTVDPPRRDQMKNEDAVRRPNYEYYEELDDGYEYCQNGSDNGNIYETLPAPKNALASANGKLAVGPPTKQQVPLPPRPPSRNASVYVAEDVSNCYESIYSRQLFGAAMEGDYESIDECLRVRGDGASGWGGSVVSSASSDDRSNSLYVYGKCQSDRSASDRTADEWVDLSDDDESDVGSIVAVREKPKIGKRNSGWSQKCREQRKKAEPTLLYEEDGSAT